MNDSRINRYTLGLIAALAFAGCGGQVAPTGGTITGAASASHGKASSGDLIYAMNGCGGTCVISYPQDKVVASLPVGGWAYGGDCVDSYGDVFITNNSNVVEYAHGGTTPIQTLNLPGTHAGGCSVDPSTGNLAVAFYSSGGNIAIFPSATGTPTTYESHIYSDYCGYDNAGNLFVSGLNGKLAELSELPVGKAGFSSLSISGSFDGGGQVQWDGSYITVEGRDTYDIRVSRLKISGSKARVVGETRFKRTRAASQSWIYGNKILIPYGTSGYLINKIGVWTYPQGGKPISKLRNFGPFITFAGVTISPG